MPCFRHTSAADNPAACSFSTLMICSSVNLLLRMSVSRRNGLYPKLGTPTGSRSRVHIQGRCLTLNRAFSNGEHALGASRLRRVAPCFKQEICGILRGSKGVGPMLDKAALP